MRIFLDPTADGSEKRPENSQLPPTAWKVEGSDLSCAVCQPGTMFGKQLSESGAFVFPPSNESSGSKSGWT